MSQATLPTIGAGEYFTPGRLFDELDAMFGPFEIDVAAQADNAKCARYFDIETNGLVQPWDAVVFCNPPYSDVLAWVRKAHAEVVVQRRCPRAALLLPSTTSTTWFHDYALPHAYLHWIRGKVRFGGLDRPAMFPSVVVVFDREGKDAVARRLETN